MLRRHNGGIDPFEPSHRPTCHKPHRGEHGAGKHVVSANKGPIAYAYSELACLAAQRGLKFLFESTVMDGTPIFNMSKYCLRGTPILGFKGILNSTTNFILGEMEKGSDFHDSVAKAQEMGFAGADGCLWTLRDGMRLSRLLY